MTDKNKQIGVVGLWHLGCVICASWIKLGYKVIGVDFDKKRVLDLQNDIPPIYEPGLKEIILEGLQSKSLSFSSDVNILKNCNFIFLSYDTPVLEDDTSDLSLLFATINKLSLVLKKNSIIIVSSQTPVGACDEMRKIMKLKNPSIELVYSPENLRLGEAIECYLKPGRIILGSASHEAEQKVKNLFSSLDAEILSMDLESAEMVKHGINSFLAMCITFANNLAEVCEYSKADILKVIRGMKSDSRIGERAYLNPGIGFSGGTLGRDLKVLERLNIENKGNSELFSFIYSYNLKRKNIIFLKIKEILGGKFKDKVIGVLGITYKPGTSTLRRSLPLEIANMIINEGAKVKVYDPKADYSEILINEKFKISKNAYEVSKDVDLLILFTEWPQFKEIDWQKIRLNLHSPIIFDTKNFWADVDFNKYGIKYYGIGR